MQNDKPPPAPPLAPSPHPPVRHRWWRLIAGLLFLAVCAALGALIAEELRSSRWQAHYLAPIAAEVGFTVEPGAADTMLRAPDSGPYDIRLGYTQMPAFLGRLSQAPYHALEVCCVLHCPQIRSRACYLFGITRFGSQVVSGGKAVHRASANSIVRNIGH